jgi:uncharacterized phage protein (TIGR01671 family)
MREIKFRAGSKGLRCMSEVLELDFQHNAIRCIPGHLPKNKMSDCILMQYTGLKDKNGKEIYEGDIVKFRTENIYLFGYVDWHYLGHFVLSVKVSEQLSNDIWFDRVNHLSDGHNGMEIIGNIHENPELLKK